MSFDDCTGNQIDLELPGEGLVVGEIVGEFAGLFGPARIVGDPGAQVVSRYPLVDLLLMGVGINTREEQLVQHPARLPRGYTCMPSHGSLQCPVPDTH